MTTPSRLPRFSVVFPTFQRRDRIVEGVRSLERQEYAGDFEIIVVVDGSTDGTLEALKALRITPSLRILSQPNSGAAVARNAGALAASGDIVLFLDDDMSADPHLLSQHEKSHREGADLVLGHIPLDPRSPRNVVSEGVRVWAEERLTRLSGREARLTLHDFLTGQLSIKAELFHRVGGFDVDFTRDGTFGNEDLDFGYRMFQKGFRVVFNPAAVSWQYYVVTPEHHLRQWRQAGRADVLFARKHPGQARQLFQLQYADERMNRRVWRPLARWRRLATPLRAAFRHVALARVRKGRCDALSETLFFEARAMEYWTGVEEGGGMPSGDQVVVLTYHAIADLSGDPILEPYGVPPEQFAWQLDLLARLGCHFVSGEEFIEYLAGGTLLPRRAVLVTFDDCYTDLMTEALPILASRRVPAVAFAVTGLLGGSNAWDQPLGARVLQLLGAQDLKRLQEEGIEIGAHSRTHPLFPQLTLPGLRDEIHGSIHDLERFGIRPPRMFSYPHGESTPACREILSECGVKAAFTVNFGKARRGQDWAELPRVEILREDRSLKFLTKIVRAFWSSPGPSRSANGPA